MLTHPLTVFLVDDCPEIVDALSRTMSEIESVRIVGRASGVRDSLQQIRNLRPDVVILDLRLEDGTGLKLLRDLGEMEGKLPCSIVFAADLSAGLHRPCLSHGAQYVFRKESSLDQMEALIHHLAVSPRQSPERNVKMNTYATRTSAV